MVVLSGTVTLALADRGVGKKGKRVTLNINVPSSLTSYMPFNLKSGLTYKGSLLTSQETIGSSIMNNSMITYQKGNTVYVLPYKHRIAVPDVQQGYTGVKFIIHP